MDGVDNGMDNGGDYNDDGTHSTLGQDSTLASAATAIVFS